MKRMEERLRYLNALEATMKRRTSPPPDIVTWCKKLGIILDPWQVEVVRSKHPRISLCCSRRVGKSFVCALLALHTALFTPRSQVLILSPTLLQSGEMLRVCRQVYVDSGVDEALIADSASRMEFANHSRIISLPGGSMAGTMRGMSGDVVLIDEASRVSTEAFAAILPVMANKPDARMITLSTPFTYEGWYADIWRKEDTDQLWWRRKVPATECPRISEEFLITQQKIMPPMLYKAEFECEFINPSGVVFKQQDIEALFV